MSQHNVVFRRIGGRVVPIRSERSDRIKGAGAVAAGIGVAAAAGAGAAHLDRDAAYSQNVARAVARTGRIQTDPKKIQRTLKQASKHAIESKRLSQSAFHVKQVGSIAGGALIGAGVHRALSEKNKKNPKTNVAVATGAGVAANFAIRSAYTKNLGRTKTFDALKHAAKRIIVRRGRF